MSSLLHTALANLQVQQSSNPLSPDRSLGGRGRPLSTTGSDSDDDDSDDDLVEVVTRPGTPTGSRTPSGRGRSRVGGVVAAVSSKDPLKALPTHLVIRIFVQLDIRSLARSNCVCKRWRKSSTLNYVWFLHTRALTLPSLAPRSQDPTSDSFDPYDKPSPLSLLRTPIPTSPTPQWSKRESKSSWRTTFGALATRKDTDPEFGAHLQVDVDALSSGYATPSGGHTHAGSGSGGREAWAADPSAGASVGATGTATPPKSKKEMREVYKSLGGRKAKGKGKMGGSEKGIRDKEGAGGEAYEAPW